MRIVIAKLLGARKSVKNSRKIIRENSAQYTICLYLKKIMVDSTIMLSSLLSVLHLSLDYT
jgi:hypothetical protein